jgi:hypothetical protein
MKHTDSFPVWCFQLVASQPLMPPDGLKQPLGGKAVFVVHNIIGTALVAPGGVKSLNGRVQSKLLLLRLGDKVNLF